MMKVLMLSNQARSMALFWRVLMETMKASGAEVVACVPDSDGRLASLEVPVIHYPLDRKGLNPLRDLETLRSLRRIFLAEKPDVLFATTIKPVIYGNLAARWARVPHRFATITGLGYAFERDTPLKKLINLVGRGLYHSSLQGCAGIFFQNPDDARLFREQGILPPHAPIRFARGTGVDTGHFAPQPLPEHIPPTFLLVGRLLEAKGIYEYAKAAQILKERHPHARFQLLGLPEHGPGSISLEQVQSLPAIDYLGQSDDVRVQWRDAHVAVLPSWREGLPTALMEAMSVGRPLVATDVPGCREVVRPGVNGFLVRPHDAASLAQAMGQFLEHPELMAAMGRQSRQLAVKDYDAKVVAQGIWEQMLRSLS